MPSRTIMMSIRISPRTYRTYRESLRIWCQRTHRSGLKVIIDFVPNHVARQYHSDAQPDGTSQLGSNDDTNYAFSPYNNFYYIPKSELHGQFDMKGTAAESYREFPAKATGNKPF